jgi:glycosyltransferase involved in cell wall biosynthesis
MSSKAKKVLLTVPHLSKKSSPFRETVALAKYLPKDEFELTVCSLRNSGFNETQPLLKSLGVESFVGFFRPFAEMMYLKSLGSSLKQQSVIDSYGPFDIQHSLDFVSMPFEALVARLKSRRYIFNQGILAEDLNKLMLRMKCKFAHGIIAVSDSVMNVLTELGVAKNKIRKIPLGIDTQESDLQLRSNGPTRSMVLMVANVLRYKRHEDGIRAFALLAPKRPELRMAIVGRISDKSYHSELEKLIRELKLEDRIEFLGARSDVIDLMKEAAMLIHCAEPEAFGWVILEAMAVGLPVIAAAAGGPGEIVEHNRTGLLAPVSSIEDFAEAIQRTLEDHQFTKRMVQNARSVIEEQYSARKMVEQTVDFYREFV